MARRRGGKKRGGKGATVVSPFSPPMGKGRMKMRKRGGKSR